jgi:hypothetical protein
MNLRGRVKMCLHAIEDYGTSIKTFRFMAVQDPTIPDPNKLVTKTPAGELRITIEHPGLTAGLKVGTYYYLDLSPVPPQGPAPGPPWRDDL